MRKTAKMMVRACCRVKGVRLYSFACVRRVRHVVFGGFPPVLLPLQLRPIIC